MAVHIPPLSSPVAASPHVHNLGRSKDGALCFYGTFGRTLQLQQPRRNKEWDVHGFREKETSDRMYPILT
ncbi:hypothetical protein QR685DRAFT_568830 [Neurospora intermedia]|uniref:Uncharacterized protein n=1 Tax=Neurospora intermedia TaxID=5142 RepID=A0ABR3DU28_NEUIN